MARFYDGNRSGCWNGNTGSANSDT
jgi:hypothetical protein